MVNVRFPLHMVATLMIMPHHPATGDAVGLMLGQRRRRWPNINPTASPARWMA